MNYTPEQFAQAVLKALKEVNTPDVSKLLLQERKELATNPNTPPETLTILARDEDCLVRCGVERKPSSTREVIQTVRAYEFYKSLNEVAHSNKP